MSKADVAELLDARDLKSQGPIVSIQLCLQTMPLDTIEIDGTKRDLQNILARLSPFECADDFALIGDVTGVVLTHALRLIAE